MKKFVYALELLKLLGLNFFNAATVFWFGFQNPKRFVVFVVNLLLQKFLVTIILILLNVFDFVCLSNSRFVVYRRNQRGIIINTLE